MIELIVISVISVSLFLFLREYQEKKDLEYEYFAIFCPLIKKYIVKNGNLIKSLNEFSDNFRLNKRQIGFVCRYFPVNYDKQKGFSLKEPGEKVAGRRIDQLRGGKL